MASKKQLHKVATFIGIDLAWSARNPSGAAVIRNERLVACSGKLGSTDEICRFIKKHMPKKGPTIVGIDAPLRVPNETGSRRCDRELSAEWRRYQAGALPANRRLLGQYAKDTSVWSEPSRNKKADQRRVRGETLVNMLVQRLHFTEAAPIPRHTEDRLICEIYPHPAHISLFGLDVTLKYKPRPGRSYETRWGELERYQRLLRRLRKATPALKHTKKLLTKTDVRLLRGRKLKEHEDKLDAISCAYVASFLWHHGPRRTRVYGSVAEGHIVVPITQEMEERLVKHRGPEARPVA